MQKSTKADWTDPITRPKEKHQSSKQATMNDEIWAIKISKNPNSISKVSKNSLRQRFWPQHQGFQSHCNPNWSRISHNIKDLFHLWNDSMENNHSVHAMEFPRSKHNINSHHLRISAPCIQSIMSYNTIAIKLTTIWNFTNKFPLIWESYTEPLVFNYKSLTINTTLHYTQNTTKLSF